MFKLFDRVKGNTPTTGTGDITFGSVSSNAFLTPTEAGCAAGDNVRYLIVDGTDFEVGIGTIGGSVATMARTTVTKSKIGGTAGTSKINLSGTAVFGFTAGSEDILIPLNNLSDLDDADTALDNLGGTTVGKALFTATDAAAAQTAIGGTTVGKAVLTAADAAGARDAIGSSPGSVVNSADSSYATYTSLTAQIPGDDTIPQSTEGTQILTCSITPTKSANNLRVKVSIPEIICATSLSVVGAVFRDSGANAVGAAIAFTGATLTSLNFSFVVSAASTSATTFKLRVGPTASGTIYVNGNASARQLGGIQVATMTIEEIEV